MTSKKEDLNLLIAADDDSSKSFWLGVCGGISDVLVSHPLDTGIVNIIILIIRRQLYFFKYVQVYTLTILHIL